MHKIMSLRKVNGDAVEETGEMYSELSGLAKENILLNLDRAHSLVEENKRFLDTQLENMNKIQAEYANRIKSIMGGLPKGHPGFGFLRQFDRMIELQNGHFSFVKKLSDNYTKELLDLNQESAERAFDSADKCMSFFGY